MTTNRFTVDDLPLGTLAPDALYHRLVVDALNAEREGRPPGPADLVRIAVARDELLAELQGWKDEGLRAFAERCARRYGFALDAGTGGVAFPWKALDHRRVGYESGYYTCDLAEKRLVPATLDHGRPRMVVFATGRAFAEKNARLLHLTREESIKNAKSVMSAQIYLSGSRLVPGFGGEGDPAQVAALAYDMVTSEAETPALRIQTVLDPAFRHPVSTMAAERIFGPQIARAAFHENGTFARTAEGRIDGAALGPQAIVDNVSSLCLVGGSVGCIVCAQAVRGLDALLVELGVDEEVRHRALGSVLQIHLGPTTVIPIDERTNRISVVNRFDEFVLAGNDIEPVLTESRRSGRSLVPHPRAEASAAGRAFAVALDVPATLYTRRDASTGFDPIGAHFGHSLKHYANGLRAIGLSSVVGRALATRGPFRVGDLVDEAEAAGELTTYRR